ncbi:reticulon-4-interacting protein 1 homolog, mitochondrial-like [Planococcus citri]|uniref:reticulon-4-interacting protein 1 homolog, mitochondrial-like n=1 Tax=Planococcus citri TaxID=170843 RepID=UPI0031F9FEE3
MEDLVCYLSQFTDYLLNQIIILKHEANTTLESCLRETRDMVVYVSSNTSIETLLTNIQNHLNQLYLQLIIIPYQNSFYVPNGVNHLRNFSYSIRLWNRSHAVAGLAGFFVGGCLFTLLGQHLFTRTKYLAPMRAVVAKNDRGVQGINYFEEASIPLLSNADEVLIHVKAGSLDPIDIQIALGHGKVLRELFNNNVLKKRNDYPIILGRDCAGVIVEIGQNVKKFEVGDEVWAAVPYWMTGTLAEYVAVKECFVAHKPERLDFFDAASLPYSGCIALDCVKNRAGIVDSCIGRGKRVLVHAGNTAIGCIIIQLCSIYNVSITTSCMSQAVNKMLDAGAQSILLLDHMSPDLPQSRRYDIVFNTVGSAAEEFCVNMVRNDGLLINASSEYYIPQDWDGYLLCKIYSFWLKILQKCGVNLWKDVPLNSSILDELSELVNEGRLYPVTDSVFKVKSCERAFWFLNSTKVVGKPVIYFNTHGDTGFN